MCPTPSGLQGKKAISFPALRHTGVYVYNDTVVVTEEFLAANRPLLTRWLRASRMGWTENFKDPAKYPKDFKNSWFSGTGRATANDIYTNTANQPLIDTPNGIFRDDGGLALPPISAT